MGDSIRKICPEDKITVLELMREFYSSEAVYTNGSDEIFNNDIEQCFAASPYLEGYVFVCDKKVCGYAMLAKSFSTEFGKPCIWIEDIYISDSFRGRGLGSAFLMMLDKNYPDCVFRLEVEAENEKAVELYKKYGFDFLPYLEMKK